jgi:hypothetical protein
LDDGQWQECAIDDMNHDRSAAKKIVFRAGSRDEHSACDREATGRREPKTVGRCFRPRDYACVTLQARTGN